MATRLVWGTGDGSTLEVYETPYGRLGGLLCWENYMPLARAALYTQGIDIYIAPTWDNNDAWIASMRHIAREGRCYVIGVNSCICGSDIPAEVPNRDALYGGDEDWLSRGNTLIAGPGGDLLAGPLIEERGIVYAEIDAAPGPRQPPGVRRGRPLRAQRRVAAEGRPEQAHGVEHPQEADDPPARIRADSDAE